MLLGNRCEAYLRMGSHQWAVFDLTIAKAEELMRADPGLKLPRGFKGRLLDRRKRAAERDAAETRKGDASTFKPGEADSDLTTDVKPVALPNQCR